MPAAEVRLEAELANSLTMPLNTLPVKASTSISTWSPSFTLEYVVFGYVYLHFHGIEVGDAHDFGTGHLDGTQYTLAFSTEREDTNAEVGALMVVRLRLVASSFKEASDDLMENCAASHFVGQTWCRPLMLWGWLPGP